MQVSSKFTPVSSVLLVVVLFSVILQHHQLEAKRHQQSKSLVRCQQDECQLRPEQYVIFKYVKNAIESDFDLTGKQIYPFLRSVELLKRRFGVEQNSTLRGAELVQPMLKNKTLIDAVKIFESADGLALVDLYKSSVDGRRRNHACSELRIRSLERAADKLDSDQKLASVFKKIHQNFSKLTAKICLKRSCTSIDVSMSKLDSILARKWRSPAISDEGFKLDDDDSTFTTTTTQETVSSTVQSNSLNANKSTGASREFETEELELCHFFQRNNQFDCQVSGNELSEISLLKGRQEDELELLVLAQNKTSPSLADYLKSYYVNIIASSSAASETSVGTTEADMKIPTSDSANAIEQAGRAVLSSCRAIRPTLDYNLFALKWYSKQNLIPSHKLIKRSIRCPSLSYWLQLDRLCSELETSLSDSDTKNNLTNGTFAYQISTNKHYMNVVNN